MDLLTKILPKPYHRGSILIVASVIITFGLWLGTMALWNDWYDDHWKYFAKIGSMGATMLMCWAFLLATRWRWLETLFGGLDKAYKVHRRVGETAFALILLHPLFLAMHRMPDILEFLSFFWFSEDAARNTGIVAIVMFAVLILLSVYMPVAYHHWKITHNFFGLLLLLVIWHAYLGQGEIAKYPALRIWFTLWITAALVSYIYIRVLYRWIGPLHVYRVTEVNQDEDAELVELKLESRPRWRRIRSRPGQFIYISLRSRAVDNEPHPFSMSSSPQDPTMRLSIKKLGDWTKALDDVKPGEKAYVWGPYGKFGKWLMQHPDEDAVLVAGGIGVTPFLSMIGDSRIQRRRGKLWFVYSVVEESDAAYAEEIKRITGEHDHFEFVPHVSGDDNYLTPEFFEEHVGSLEDKIFFICGPGPMMEGLIPQLTDAGVPTAKIFTEDFSFA